MAFPRGDGFFTAEESAILAGSFFGVLGALIGTPIGTIVGSEEVYHIEHGIFSIRNWKIGQACKSKDSTDATTKGSVRPQALVPEIVSAWRNFAFDLK